MMDVTFQDLIEECIVIIYMDDIFIFAKDKEKLANNTKRVLQRLRENDLFLKPKKCEFEMTRIEWLGMTRIIKEGKIQGAIAREIDEATPQWYPSPRYPGSLIAHLQAKFAELSP